MTKEQEALKLALEALIWADAQGENWQQVVKKAIKPAQEALAQPKQKPVAWMYTSRLVAGNQQYITQFQHDLTNYKADKVWPLYTTPPAAQPVQPAKEPHVRYCPDWKDLYEKQKRRAEMWIAKYEKDIGPLEKAVPVAQPEQEPVAWRTFDGEGGYEYRTYDMNEDYANDWEKRNPNHKGWVDPLYKDPTPCQTCQALARTVMLDQTSHDTTPPVAQPVQEPVAWLNLEKLAVGGMAYATAWKTTEKQSPLYTTPQPRPWVGLTDEEIADAVRPLYGTNESAFMGLTDDIPTARAIEAKLKELNK